LIFYAKPSAATATKELDVVKRISPKKLIDEWFKAMKPYLARDNPQLAPPSPDAPQRRRKRTRKLARLLAKPLDKAFERSGLDADNDKHRTQLLVLLAFAVYGGRDRGQPKKWSRKRLRRLKKDLDQIKANNPSFSEAQCCEQLLKDRNSRYTGKPSTLMRRLQDAKKLDQEDQLIAASGEESVLSEISKTLKDRT
jgi:hypothetical protein